MAGDNIGASPLANGLFFEEPATIVSNLMFTDFGSVGNHEFDKGSAELLRIQNGGCKQPEGCTAKPYALPYNKKTNVYPGANFKYLSANVIVDQTGKTLFPAYGVKQIVDHGVGINVGFIGEVLRETPQIVTPTGVAGLTFLDEAEAANKAVKDLKRKGVNTAVLLIHQGGSQTAPAVQNGCNGNLAGSDIVRIAAEPRPGDQGDRVGAHPPGVPLHAHDQRRHPADHERLVVRPGVLGHHPVDQPQDRRAGRGERRQRDRRQRAERAWARCHPHRRPVEGRPGGGEGREPVRRPLRLRWPTR